MIFSSSSLLITHCGLVPPLPDKSYSVEVTEGPSSYVNEGYATLYLKSGGADSKRPITLRKKKDGNWVLWSDSILGLLSDIRKPENQNPWA